MRAFAAVVTAATSFLAVAACDPNPPQAAAPTAAYGSSPGGYPPLATGAATAPSNPSSAYPPPAYAPQAYPPQPYPAQAYPPPGYPPAAPTAYAAPPAATTAYPATPAAPYAPAPAPAQPAAPPAASGTMATPGLLALPCQNDAVCGLHHCNTQYAKCAFPCQSAADCVSPAQCIVGVCLPGGGT